MKQPTATANEASEKPAPFNSSVPASPASTFVWDPTRHAIPDEFGLCEPAPGIVTLPRCEVPSSHNNRKNMSATTKLFKKQKETAQPKQPLTAVGIYAAVVKSVAVTTKQGTEEAEHVRVDFALDGGNEFIVRIYPAKVEGRSPLVRDAKTIRGHGLTREEEADGFDPAVLVGGPARSSWPIGRTSRARRRPRSAW